MDSRSHSLLAVTVLFVLGLAFLAPARAQKPTWRDEDRERWLDQHASVEKKLMVPMRDGVRLATDLYRPKDHDGPLPTLFWRTPYNFNKLSGMRFQQGHRIRVDVSSSNFPRFARNLNTGGPNYNESEPTTAHNTVHHSKGHPSRIVLTVGPLGKGGSDDS